MQRRVGWVCSRSVGTRHSGAMPRTVAAETLAVLLDEQAPHLAGRALAELPGGQDNAVVRIGDDLVARLPKHADAAALLRHEQRWLLTVAAGLPVAVPHPVVEGRPSPGLPWPWTVSTWIDGTTADEADYDEGTMAEQLVALLRALHRPAPDDAPHNPWTDDDAVLRSVVAGVPVVGLE